MDEPCWARHLPYHVRDTRQGQERISGIADVLRTDNNLLPEPALSKSGFEGHPDNTRKVESDVGDLGFFRLDRGAMQRFQKKARPRFRQMAVRCAEESLNAIRKERERIDAKLENLDWLFKQLYGSKSSFKVNTCKKPDECTSPCTKVELGTKAEQVRVMLRLKRDVYSDVISHLGAGGSLEVFKRKRGGNDESLSTRGTAEGFQRRGNLPAQWEKNAAVMFAYVEQYREPRTLDDFEDKTDVSHRRAWDKLKEESYASSIGVSGLIDALRKWAPDFEDRYGYPKARAAAKPFDWPRQKEKQDT